ncbi:unnamed protein product [Caenorhabditis brenneri]
MCFNEKLPVVQLPEQNSLCSHPNSGCRYVEVKNGRKSWEKSLAVLIKEDGEPEAKLFIYTYFLRGIGAGKPLIGQIYSLNKPKELKAKKDVDGNIIVTIVTEKKLKLKFRIGGKDGGLWVAAIMSGSFHLISHETHAPVSSKISSELKSLKSVKRSDEASKLDATQRVSPKSLTKSVSKSVKDSVSSKEKTKSTEDSVTLKTVSGKDKIDTTEEVSRTNSEEVENNDRSEH